MSLDSLLGSGALSAEKRALLEKLLAQEGIERTQEATIPRRERTEDLTLSFAQQSLWVVDQLEGGAHYNDFLALRLTGHLNLAALQASIDDIVRRHEALRTTFAKRNGRPVQVIAPELQIPLRVVDLSACNADESEARRLAVAEIQQPFDLARGPLLRVSVFQLSKAWATASDRGAVEVNLFLLTIHHIVNDSWSIGVFTRELAALYAAYLQSGSNLVANGARNGAGEYRLGAAPTLSPYPLPELPIQYADFALWQREQLVDEKLEADYAYWEHKLLGASPILELPADRPRPAVQRFRGARHYFSMPEALTTSFQALGRQEGVTLFMSLVAAFDLLLLRYTGQDDVVIGTPYANRDESEVQNLVGMFINTLVLRTDLSGNPTFRQLLKRVQQTTAEIFAHARLPFEKLVEHLKPERDLSYNPFFQVMFTLENTPFDAIELPGLTVELFPLDSGASKFDLTLELVNAPNGFMGWFDYNTDLFDAATIARMAGHLGMLVEAVVADPDRPIGELPLLTEAERRQILVEWNETRDEGDVASGIPLHAMIHHVFETQAAATPDVLAVVSGKESLTYRAVNRRANQLAQYLRSLGVGPDVMVGICVERSPEMVIGLLGILKAGGAYVPLDPRYPRARLAFMLDEIAPEAGSDASLVLLTQSNLVADLPETTARTICLDTDWPQIEASFAERDADRNVDGGATLDTLAYVIFTSGSTGKPKGVLVEHGGMCNLARVQVEAFDVQPGDRVLQFASFSFDAAVSEVAMALLAGATLCLAQPDEMLPGPPLARLLREQAISTVTLPPSALAILPVDAYPALRTIVSAGEACSADIVARWTEGAAANRWRFLNAYGPAEATVCATIGVCDDGSRRPPVGRPIANTELYLLDQNRQPVPVGVPGEIYIGGIGLARGYLKRPDLTAEKFVRHPFSGEPGARLYRTGDLGRLLADGNIDYLGRIDHQVKVRGFRIELGEIEAVLSQYPDVRDAAVITRSDLGNGDKQLVAYVVPEPNHTLTTSELHRYLSQRVPDYMLPAAFVMLEALPVSPNGKVDRRALPAPDQDRPELEGEFVAPRDTLEFQLVQIWENALGRKPIGIRDNFFELGGHSLLAVRLFAQIEEVFGKTLSLATLFQAPTVERLAEILRQEHWEPPWTSLVAIQPGGSKPPFFCVHGGDGNVLYYRDLARHLGADQPFYALQAQGLDGRHAPHTEISEMAAHYVKEIRSLQPEGPYYLGGYCTGGTLAFEMAQQLQEQRQEVSLLALFDTQNWAGARDDIPLEKVRFQWQRLEFLWGNFSILRTHDRTAYVGHKLKIIKRRLRLWWMNLRTGGAYRYQLIEVNDGALRRYHPAKYAGRITYFRPVKVFSKYDTPSAEWQGLAEAGVERHDFRVYPGAMIEEPFVRELAAELARCLAEVQGVVVYPEQRRD